jgi:hypothetical protein
MGLGGRFVVALMCAAVTFGMTAIGSAQPRPDPKSFQVDWKKRTDPHLRPGIEGWVSNSSNYRVGSMLLKVETLDGANQVTAERTVWVYGHVPAGGRAFFVVPLRPDDNETYRISVASYDLIAREVQ